MSLHNQIIQQDCFCNWLLQNVHDRFLDSQLLFINYGAWFYNSGHVNTQNAWIWSDENPHSFQQVSLYSVGVEVCGVAMKFPELLFFFFASISV